MRTNTGEYFGPFSIKITADNNKTGENFNFTGDYSYIDLLTPLDMNYNVNQADCGNIYNNEGSAVIELAVNFSDSFYPFFSFRLDPSITTSARYVIENSIMENSLRIDENGYIRLHLTTTSLNEFYIRVVPDSGINRSGNGIQYTETDLIISNETLTKDTVYTAINSVTINPGFDSNGYDLIIETLDTDDFENPENPGPDNIRPGDDLLFRFRLRNFPEIGQSASEGDFMAVYDKKFLWRANLFIDEGAADWNNVNRWNDPDNNDWYVSQANGADVNGGQIDIHSFTDIFNRQIDNAVGYSYGCTDTVDFFNFKLEEQRAARREQSANPNLQETTAANNNWDNGYLFTLDLVHPYDPLNINGTNYYPYKPSFSSREYVNGTYTSNHTCYSAGVECQGFIMRAAGYAGNPYTQLYDIPENERMEWGEYVAKHLPGTGNWEARSWEITTYDDEETSCVVPGDIIRIGGHLGIVNRVNYDDNRIAERGDILIIEAWGGSMKVHNERTWNQFRAADSVHQLCTIRRLIQ